MRDSSVGPVGILDPRRQRRVLDGLDQRCQACSAEQEILSQTHASQRAEEEKEYAARRAAEMEACRRQRTDMLMKWDVAEEQLISQYEADAIKNRDDLKRLSVVYRRKKKESQAAIARKVEARRQAVLQQYENHKNQPGQQKRKEIQRIDEALASIIQSREHAREITVRRFDRLPQVAAAELIGDGGVDEDDLNASQRNPRPSDVSEAIESIRDLSRRCQADVNEMQSGIASRIVDHHYLPIAAVVFFVFWSLFAFAFGPQPPWIPIAAGLPIAGVLGFLAYLVLLWPLKKKTGRIYPRVERIAQAAEANAQAAKKIVTDTAQAASNELVARRDSHLAAADQWKSDQLVELDRTIAEQESAERAELAEKLARVNRGFTEQFDSTHQTMRSHADSLAQQITQHISQTDTSLQQQRESQSAHRHAQLQRLAMRLSQGTQRAVSHMITGRENVRWRFPSWADVAAGDHPVLPKLDFLPLGMLRIDERLRRTFRTEHPARDTTVDPTATIDGESADQAKSAGDGSMFDLVDSRLVSPATNGASVAAALSVDLSELDVPQAIPIVMHRRRHGAVVIGAPARQFSQAIDVAHSVLWRLLCGVTASRAKLTLIDPLGRGQHFTGFMALADHDPSLVNHRVWTTEKKIEERLSELAHRVEDVLQSSLRDRFQRIEDYNELAGSMAEPYRAIAAVGLPEGLTRDGYKHLRALIESGPRCGIFTVIVCDSTKPWPIDMPMPSGDRVLKIDLCDDGTWHVDQDGIRDLPFQPASSPPPAMRDDLIQRVGTDAVNASRVEIPLDNLLQIVDEGQGKTDSGIEIVIGSQGANRSLDLALGEGVRQHVLIAGKTGSGKSTLLHSLITSGAYRYRPDQLHYYLLDFKKGVEFKPYADSELPHARVIGIESEREFGRSVLQRLDDELQQRGEKFRSHGVQSLQDFRRESGESLPRIMLIVDEFQELFVRDDRLAGDCAMLLDRLVRQGRSFGMHVVLSSQSLAGAYSLPRATLGQMAVRIAMQCSESDAAMILADDNTAARLISRPGEAIYNDAGGLVEGNQPFQVAWLASTRHRELLGAIAARDSECQKDLPAQVVFEGNRPCRWSPSLASNIIQPAGDATGEPGAIRGLLGESVEIGPPQSIQLTRNTGRNVLLIAPAEAKGPILASALSGFAKSRSDTSIVYLDGNRVDDGASLGSWLNECGLHVAAIKPRDAESEIVRLSALVKQRGEESENEAPVVVVIDPLERFRDLRQNEAFSFSLDAPAAGETGSAALQSLLRDGPAANVFVILVCGSAETLSRWLPRSAHHDLELRILGRMNASDSSALIDTPAASDLSAATVLLYDDADGGITKFRQCDLPDPDAVRDWLASGDS
tara:strand:+ start:566730 stop:570806 length:4077 start_codon:yes stop_codon:yes gene_type:complete